MGSQTIDAARRRPPAALLALLLACLAVRLAVALAHPYSLMETGIVQDDAFYYLTIARNAVAGRGLTFDGQSQTSGFHPLYLLQLVPLVKLTDADPVLTLRLAAVLQAVLATVAGLAIYGLARQVAKRGPALLCLALWAFHPYFITGSLNGQETGLVALFAAASAYAFLKILAPGRPARRWYVLLGLTWGLGFLARSDFLLLGAAMGGVAGRRWLTAAEFRQRTAGLTAAVVVAATVWLPWGLTSRALTGDWLPRSGPASRIIALNLGWFELDHFWSSPQAPDPFDPAAPPRAWFADVLTKGVFTYALEQPLLAPLRANLPFDPWPALGRYVPYRLYRAAPPILRGLVAIAVAAALAALALTWLRPRRLETGPAAVLPALALVHAAVTVVAYATYCPSHWYFPRYFVPSILLTMIAGIGLIAGALARPDAPPGKPPLENRRRYALPLALLVLAVPVVHGGMLLARLRWHEPAPTGFLATWRSVEPLLGRGVRLAAFQAGTYSWFGRRDVINLDGKVNPAAFAAVQTKTLHRYIRDNGIQFILDWPLLMDRLVLRFAPPGALRLGMLSPDGRALTPALYRVQRQ